MPPAVLQMPFGSNNKQLKKKGLLGPNTDSPVSHPTTPSNTNKRPSTSPLPTESTKKTTLNGSLDSDEEDSSSEEPVVSTPNMIIQSYVDPEWLGDLELVFESSHVFKVHSVVMYERSRMLRTSIEQAIRSRKQHVMRVTLYNSSKGLKLEDVKVYLDYIHGKAHVKDHLATLISMYGYFNDSILENELKALAPESVHPITENDYTELMKSGLTNGKVADTSNFYKLLTHLKYSNPYVQQYNDHVSHVYLKEVCPKIEVLIEWVLIKATSVLSVEDDDTGAYDESKRFINSAYDVMFRMGYDEQADMFKRLPYRTRDEYVRYINTKTLSLNKEQQ